jgi:hypothetical protein
MKRIFIILALLTFSASYFTSCSEETVTPTEEGGSTQESTEQWD